jgi:hypothetical protein
MKSQDMIPGTLVAVPAGVGIVVKTGVREVTCVVAGRTWEEVVLVLVKDEPKWYNLEQVNLVDHP